MGLKPVIDRHTLTDWADGEHPVVVNVWLDGEYRKCWFIAPFKCKVTLEIEVEHQVLVSDKDA